MSAFVHTGETTDSEVPSWLRGAASVVGNGEVLKLLPQRRRPQEHELDPQSRPLRDAAVLVAISGEQSSPSVEPPPGAALLLTERSATMRSHSGQIAFPGGAADPEDDGPISTALREAQEETGLNPSCVSVLAVAPQLFIPVSNFSVSPVLAHWHTPSTVSAMDEREVASVMEVPLDQLLEPENRFFVAHPGGWKGPAFQLDERIVWGFTAGVLSALFCAAGWEREWDTERVLDLETTLAKSANKESSMLGSSFRGPRRSTDSDRDPLAGGA